MAAEGNSYNSQYYDLDRNIEDNSLFKSLKDLTILSSIVVILATMTSNYITNDYVNMSLKKGVNLNAQTIQEKEIATNKLIENYKISLESNGMFNLANKVSNKLAIFDKESIIDKNLNKLINDVIQFDNLKDLESKSIKLSELKTNFIKEHKIDPNSKDGIILEIKYQIEVEPILKEIEIIKNYNSKILELKEKNKVLELTKD